MIERLLPAPVASVQARDEPLEIELLPEEQRLLDGAVEKRRREFVTGRACARRALQKLGLPATAIARGPRGEPLWPPAVVGSITHCRRYTASAVARASDLVAIGIDAEANEALGAVALLRPGPDLVRGRRGVRRGATVGSPCDRWREAD